MDRSPVPMPDRYEAEYMAAEGGLLHERRRMPGWFFAFMAAIALVELGVTLSTGRLLPALVAVPVLAAITLLLSHLRVVLTGSHLHIQYGLWGPKIALADIVAVRVEPYSMLRFGGFGIRRSLDGVWAYSTPGGKGTALVVETRGGRKYCITLDEAERFRARIEALRAEGAASGVRVALEDGEGVTAEEHETGQTATAPRARR